MTQKIHELVSVTCLFDHKNLTFLPQVVTWKNRDYKIIKLGLHHTFVKGNVLYHVFSVTTQTLFLRLVFNSKNLNWHLEEITNGF